MIHQAVKSWEDFLFDGVDENERELFMIMLERLSQKAASYVEQEREGEK